MFFIEMASKFAVWSKKKWHGNIIETLLYAHTSKTINTNTAGGIFLCFPPFSFLKNIKHFMISKYKQWFPYQANRKGKTSNKI